MRSALTGEKLIGGTQTAESMEEAANRVCDSNHITVETEEHKNDAGHLLWVTKHHKYKDRRVYLYITAHPEYLAT